MITTVLFDWDGVIVDSMPIIAKGIQDHHHMMPRVV